MYILHVLRYFKSLKINFKLLLFSLIIIIPYSSNTASNNNIIHSNTKEDLNIILKKTEKLHHTVTDKIIELIDLNNNKSTIKNYLFYSIDFTQTIAYSGKPLELLIHLKSNGLIENLKLIKHSEPILLTGIPIEKLLEAVAFYKNKNINKKINIGENSSGELSIPIISGATVTSLILHETILSSCRNVGMTLNFIDKDIISSNSLNNLFQNFSWDKLIKIKAIKHYTLDETLTETTAKQTNLFVDLYFADIKHPSIGKNLLGDYYYTIIEKLSDDDSAIIILNNGTWSFKGSGFVRGGIYDRFRIEQNNNIFTFRDIDFQNVYELPLYDIDKFKESGIFIINNKKYKPWKEWNLILLLDYKTFSIPYKIPDKFCKKHDIIWLKTWTDKLFYISLFLSIWFIVILIFLTRNTLVKNNFYLSMSYNIILVLDIYILGILFEAQPSIVNIFSLIDNIKNLEAFLFDPYIFLSWIMIISTIFIWGKALFCGWICPFGALQETLFKIKTLLFKSKFNLELIYNSNFKYTRYIFLLLLIIISTHSLKQAELAAEIEPFKTIWIIGINNRPYYISIYTIALITTSIFIYRFFCRFICPLGAFLSLLSFNILLKLRRRGTCSVCHICEKTCNSKAINTLGIIDTKECFGCFSCIQNMYNENICPPIKKKKLRDKYEKNIWW